MGTRRAFMEMMRMTDSYHIWRGPPCGSPPNCDTALRCIAAYPTFTQAVNNLPRGYAPIAITRETRGTVREVWPALDHSPLGVWGDKRLST